MQRICDCASLSGKSTKLSIPGMDGEAVAERLENLPVIIDDILEVVVF